MNLWCPRIKVNTHLSDSDPVPAIRFCHILPDKLRKASGAPSVRQNILPEKFDFAGPETPDGKKYRIGAGPDKCVRTHKKMTEEIDSGAGTRNRAVPDRKGVDGPLCKLVVQSNLVNLKRLDLEI